ncbi:hypothetical protein [Thalassobium sp. R2A62]|jgi:hypothetical protein|uniref:hypothetical protein n=1 Tax=Thalassobium sp. R2A62 TaxID=633131 RepID=UPI0001B1CC2D|nr:hypothetical protein [Thalassobium sp. R2A62]EET48338.1 hypothetical protein TR2A62_1070 [Thalassobium sp. R2A62]
MSQFLRNLMHMDELAQKYGIGLNPTLKEAIRADVSFPSKAATPQLTKPLPDHALPENATRLPVPDNQSGRRRV